MHPRNLQDKHMQLPAWLLQSLLDHKKQHEKAILDNLQQNNYLISQFMHTSYLFMVLYQYHNKKLLKYNIVSPSYSYRYLQLTWIC